MTLDLLVRNATIVCGDAAGTVIEGGALGVADGRIVTLGPTEAVADVVAARVVDATGMLLAPGLVNTHCHAGDSLFRGLIEELPLEPWLQLVWRAEQAILSPETVRLGATLGFVELLLGGVTTTLDMFWHPREAVAAARALGVRVATGGMFFDGPGPDGLTAAERAAEAAAFLADFAGAPDVLPGTFPHGAYTVSPEGLVAAKRMARDGGALYSVHAAETKAEQATISDRYGRSVIRHLDALDLLDAQTILAHCVWLDDEEIEILARSGVSVAHNPVSNLKLASGIARVPDLLSAGVPVTLGTDGAISGNDLDLWMALRLAATLHRGATLRADAVSSKQAWRMVTLDAATALGASDRIGSLEAGKWADMILIDLATAHAAPLFDPLTHLVFSTAKSDVRHVFVGGRQVVADRRPVGIDLDALLDEVRSLAPRIAASLRD